jgi:Protein of unknown function, DUF547
VNGVKEYWTQLKEAEGNWKNLRENTMNLNKFFLIAAMMLTPFTSALAQFDHSHKAWDALLKKNIVVVQGGKTSQARYAGFKQDEAALKAYTESLSAVSDAQFKGFSKNQQMAFLINAYNAFTVQLILTKYPELKSIKDLGGAFSSPWKQKFFKLFGQDAFLDQIEHETLRKKGVYDEPRVHYAVNCASIGCPALREEAFTADKLDAQLEQQAMRFLSDRSRNRYNAQRDSIEVSKIFDWFKEDWQSGYKGIGKDQSPVTSREQYFGKYATLLSDNPAEQKLIADGKVAIRFLDYDWNLNDAKR